MGDEQIPPPAVFCHQPPVFRFDRPPRRIYHFHRQFRPHANPRGNFLKGIKWSPDGSCFLVSSRNNCFRVFSLPEDAFTTDHSGYAAVEIDGQDSYNRNVIVKNTGIVSDFCWYPRMIASDPESCYFSWTSRDKPIKTYCSNTGQFRSGLGAYDNYLSAPNSISFNPSGTKLFAGFDKSVKVFDHPRGRSYGSYSFFQGTFSSGIISSIALSPIQNTLIAVGSYNKQTAICSEDNMRQLFVLRGQQGGVTQVLFSKDGNYVYTGGRKDPYLLCWDLRRPSQSVYRLYRSTENTEQRISFDIDPCGRHLGAGGEDGLVHIYDLQTRGRVLSFQAASDTVNGFSFHPSLPLAASSSGHQRFDMPNNASLRGDENCVSVWSFSHLAEQG